MTNPTEIPIEDQVCECGHWYGEHVAADAEGPACCEGCHIALEGWTPEELKGVVPVEHEFKFSAEFNTPEAIADRGGDPEKWPQHVKDYFEREGA